MLHLVLYPKFLAVSIGSGLEKGIDEKLKPQA